LLVVGLSVTPGGTLAQDYGTATPAMQMAGEGHPAHIHDGTCANLGGIAHPLTNFTHEGMMSTPMAGMESTPMAEPGEEVESQSSTTVEATIDDLLGEDYAINVHESMDKIDVYIACGDIDGTPENGQLQIELQEQNNSGVHGMAWLTDNGDGTTTVDVVLLGMHGMMGTPEASPAP
jgi:hypothetical protein